MNDTIKQCLAHGEEVRAKYRKSLLFIGKSPDYHIADLSLYYLYGLKGSRAKQYLIKVRRFYEALNESDQRIFVYEVLEKKRHYLFWFLGEDWKPGEFERMRDRVLLDTRRSL